MQIAKNIENITELNMRLSVYVKPASTPILKSNTPPTVPLLSSARFHAVGMCSIVAAKCLYATTVQSQALLFPSPYSHLLPYEDLLHTLWLLLSLFVLGVGVGLAAKGVLPEMKGPGNIVM